jgi:type II secretory pathway pseudopilin PulG
MKKNSAIVLSIIGALALIAAAINPTMQAYAQNTVDATQSNSFTADISQSASQDAQTGGETDEETGEETDEVTDEETDGDSGDVSQDISQGFCLQVNQQNAAAGNDASNTGSNEIEDEADCS